MLPCLLSLPLACHLPQNRMNKLESLRLEVDSRRRTVAKLGKKVGGRLPVLEQESWGSAAGMWLHGLGLAATPAAANRAASPAATCQACPAAAAAVHRMCCPAASAACCPPCLLPCCRCCAQVDLQRARLPQTRAKGEYEMENTIKVLQHKESKLSACRQSFKEHEALVYHQLTNLIRDTVWLKSYLSGALLGLAGLGPCNDAMILPAASAVVVCRQLG